MHVHYLPVDAWHLIRHTLLKHPPKIIGAAAAFFIFQIVMGRLRKSDWIGCFVVATMTTALLAFIVASLYILFTRTGYRLM